MGVSDFFYDIKELQEFQTSDLYILYWEQERDNSLIPNHSKHKAKQNKTKLYFSLIGPTEPITDAREIPYVDWLKSDSLHNDCSKR